MTVTGTAALLVAVGAASALVPSALAAFPAHAVGSTYVALGDSYAAGTGTRSQLSDGTSCQRSVYAYPALIASSNGYALDLRACSGATTADVAGLQLGALGAATSYVTVQVGGNDAGFTSVLTQCALPAWAADCHGALDRAGSFITGQLPGRLRSLYAAVRSRAPRAQVVVVGYPRLFNGVDCNALTWFSPTEQWRLNETSDLLNVQTAAAAGAAGFSFAPASFAGHAVCASTEWVNGLSAPVSESYHPNRLGHAAGYTPSVGRRLTGSTTTATATDLERAVASAGQLAARQRTHAALDRRIRPETFVAPDLDSPQLREAAARAGVDLADQRSIDAADRWYDAVQNSTR